MMAVSEASPSLPAGSSIEPAANCMRMETSGELGLGSSTTSMAAAFLAVPAASASDSSRPPARTFGFLLMAGTSLRALAGGGLLLGGRMGKGHFGLVLRPERGAGEPLDVGRGHLVVLRVAKVEILDVAGQADD